jgi:hypothetical protein
MSRAHDIAGLLASKILRWAEGSDVEPREPAAIDSPIVVEKWFDRQGLARHFACSLPMIDAAVHDGMPYSVIFGRKKFHASEVEDWLERTGRLEHRGEVPSKQVTNGQAVI